MEYTPCRTKKKRAWTDINTARYLNPLVPSAANMRRNAKILILILDGIIKKISYESRDYESVDEKNLSKSMSRKIMKKIIQAVKG